MKKNSEALPEEIEEPPSEWSNWHWQLDHRIQTFEELSNIIQLSDEEKNALLSDTEIIPLAITPYYARLLSKTNPNQPLRRAVVPTTAEFIVSHGELEDPLGEEDDSPVPGIVHRYPDRVLFLVTDCCSTYCRYCTRSRMVGRSGKRHASMDQWEGAIEYIKANKSIRDVLISGGDPLVLPDKTLRNLLRNVRQIPHVEILRIGTKVPVVLPQRITEDLLEILKENHPLWINIHFMHPDEITKETSEACIKLANIGIPLGSQTVLLKNINDSVEIMKSLIHKLLKIRVRPYYLYQCDTIQGSAHFRTPVSTGIKIIEGLRGHTTGFAVPSYVIDAPGGGGKVPITPDYFVGRNGTDVILRNYENKQFRYPDIV